MKLLSFFKLTYLLPTSLFLFISIVIAFLYMLTFLNEYTSDEHINKISSKSVNKDWTLISSIQELLSYRIQLVFDSFALLKFLFFVRIRLLFSHWFHLY